MIDKQIIIDGVDVSGCACYVNTGECTNENVYPDYCKACSNCIYKLEQQLKRKEQECETLASQLDFEVQKKECLEQESKKLKSDLTDLSKIIDCKNGTILTFKEQLDQLKTENEELKKRVCGLRPELKSIIDKTCSKYNIQVKTYHEKIVEIINNLDKYEQTLTEIKEIAELFCNTCQEFEPEKRGRNCMYCNYGKILQKISEVEDEYNTKDIMHIN